MTPAGLVASGSVRWGSAPCPHAAGAHAPAASSITTMDDAVFTTSSLGTAPPAGDTSEVPRSRPREDRPSWLALAPIAFVVLLLLVATPFQGAFHLRQWAPPTIFTLVLLVTITARGGGIPVARTWLAVVLAGIWGFAAWTLLSAAWSPSPSAAWEAAARSTLYAALVSVPLVAVRQVRTLRIAARAITIGIALIAMVVTAVLFVDGPSLFLAGRLDGPIHYRNATALLFCLGVWPLIGAMAARDVPRGLRALALSWASLELGLAFLAQSRGTVLGLLCGAVVSIALGPERVRRVWIALLAVALLVAVSPMLLTPYEAFDGGHGIVESHHITSAAVGLLVLAGGGFLLGLLIAIFDGGLRPQALHNVHITARWALAAVAVVGVVGALAVVGDPVAKVQDKWEQFTDLNAASTGSTRLTFAGGQRSDLWRVSLRELSGHPVAGVGAGGYPFDYYRERHSDRNLDDPHGLPFQILGELGLVGALLFATFVVGAAGAVLRGWRGVPLKVRRTASGAAATGAVLLGQAAVDWMWLIPGITGLGLFSLALAGAMVVRSAPDDPAERAPRLATGWRLAIGGGLLAAAASIALLYLSDVSVRDARAQIGRSAAAQLSAAESAAALSPTAVTPRYLEAGALESLGRRAEARATLLQALDLEPRNLTTLGLLGDLETRAGHGARARAYYRRALALDPLDVGLRQLAGLPVTSP